MNPYIKKYQNGGKGDPEDPYESWVSQMFNFSNNSTPLINQTSNPATGGFSWGSGYTQPAVTKLAPINKEYAVGTTVPSLNIPIELSDIQKEQNAIRKQQQEKEAKRQEYLAQRNEANKYIPGQGKTNALGLYNVPNPNEMRVHAMNQAATQAAEFTGVPSVIRVAKDPASHLQSALRVMDGISTFGTMPGDSYNTPEDLSKALDVASAVGTILPVAKGLNTAEGLNIAGKYLTTNTPLKNTWMLNPYATRLRQYNRVVGQDAIDDFIESGLVRSGQYGGVDRGSVGGISLTRKTPYPSFSAGKPSQAYINQTIDQGKNPFIISTNRPMAPSTLGRHGKGSTMFPVDESGQFLESFPATQAELFESTPHWIKGYQKTFNPYSDDVVEAVKRWENIGNKGLSRKEVNAQNKIKEQWMKYHNELKRLESEGYKASDKPVIDVINSMTKIEEDFHNFVINNRYNEAGMSKFFELPGGSGSFGTVFPFKENSSLLYKVGTLSPTDTYESTLELIKKGSQINDPNISIPKSLVQIPDATRGLPREFVYGSVIKKVPGSSAKSYSRTSKIPQEAIEEMSKKLDMLKKKGIEADYAGDNFFYDPNTGKLSVFDLNTSSNITQLPANPKLKADWTVRVNRSNEDVSDILNNVFGNKQTNTGKLPSLMLPGQAITKGRSVFGSQPIRTLNNNTLKNNMSLSNTQNRYGGQNPYIMPKYKYGGPVEPVDPEEERRLMQERLMRYIRGNNESNNSILDVRSPNEYGFSLGDRFKIQSGLSLDPMTGIPSGYGKLGINNNGFNLGIEKKKGIGTDASIYNIGYEGPKFNIGASYSKENNIPSISGNIGYNNNGINIGVGGNYSPYNKGISANLGYNNNGINAGLNYDYSGQHSISGNIGYGNDIYNVGLSGNVMPGESNVGINATYNLGVRKPQKREEIAMAYNKPIEINLIKEEDDTDTDAEQAVGPPEMNYGGYVNPDDPTLPSAPVNLFSNYDMGYNNPFVDDIDSAMNGMMKARMAIESEIGMNPAAKRMTSLYPKEYIFTGDEMFYDEKVNVPAGSIGTHYTTGDANVMFPIIQENKEGNLFFNRYASPMDKEAMRFETPEEASYFGENYKNIAPMMYNQQEYEKGGNTGHSTVEIERSERVYTPDGELIMETPADAPTHEEGGVKVTLPGGSLVFPKKYFKALDAASGLPEFKKIAKTMLDNAEKAYLRGEPYSSGGKRQ